MPRKSRLHLGIADGRAEEIVGEAITRRNTKVVQWLRKFIRIMRYGTKR